MSNQSMKFGNWTSFTNDKKIKFGLSKKNLSTTTEIRPVCHEELSRIHSE